MDERGLLPEYLKESIERLDFNDVASVDFKLRCEAVVPVSES